MYLGTYERTVRVKKVKINLFKLILNSGKNINAPFQILFAKDLMITTAISFLNQNPLICIKGKPLKGPCLPLATISDLEVLDTKRLRNLISITFDL